MGSVNGDGSVVSSKMPVGGQYDPHRKMFGIYRGQVIKTVYPDDPQSNTKNRMEYVVRVKGQNYPNAIDMRDAGGIYNYKERVRKHTEKSFSGPLDDTQYPENLDGEMVYVMMIEGNGDIPLIVGGDTHPKHAKYKNPKRSDGLFDREEYNGVEWFVDKSGNFTLTIVGLKDVNGNITNQAAVGTLLKLASDGSALLKALGNSLTLDSSGANLTDKNGNSVVMTSGGVTVTSSGPCTVKSSGALSVEAGGAISLKAAGDSLNGGLVTNNPANNDPITGIPLQPVGGITTS